jgi:hypothetical protein
MHLLKYVVDVPHLDRAVDWRGDHLWAHFGAFNVQGTSLEFECPYFPNATLLFCIPHWPWCPFIVNTNLLLQTWSHYRYHSAQNQELFLLLLH